MKTIWVFVAAFSMVALLGLQSLFINRGKAWQACTISAAISAIQVFIWRHLDTDGQMLAYVLGGPVGVMIALQVFPYIRGKKGPLE